MQNQYNIGQQLLSLGIVLFELPSNLLLYRIGPGRWLSSQVVAFGLVSTFQAFQNSYGAFLATRLLLGLTESGYIPGALYTLSTWCKRSSPEVWTPAYAFLIHRYTQGDCKARHDLLRWKSICQCHFKSSRLWYLANGRRRREAGLVLVGFQPLCTLLASSTKLRITGSSCLWASSPLSLVLFWPASCQTLSSDLEASSFPNFDFSLSESSTFFAYVSGRMIQSNRRRESIYPVARSNPRCLTGLYSMSLPSYRNNTQY